MTLLVGVARRWVAARPADPVKARCLCSLGCTEPATAWGYNRHMEHVPLALGHGRKMGEGS